MLFLDDNAADAQLEQARRTRSGSIAIVVRGWKCQTKETLHNEIGAALQLPGYYGENWNALDECLHDLSWLPAERYLLVINCVEKLLHEDDQSLVLFLDVLSEASRIWSERGVLFEVIFCGNRAGLDRALTLFRSGAAAVAAVNPAAGISVYHRGAGSAAGLQLNGKALIWNDPASSIIGLPVFSFSLLPPWRLR